MTQTDALIVILGLDLRIHQRADARAKSDVSDFAILEGNPETSGFPRMDARVKPGHDGLQFSRNR